MKSPKIFALIISTIALFPSASWADEMSINQEIEMNSTNTGNGRVTSIETQQQSVRSPQADRYSRKNTWTIYHKINSRAASVGAISSSRTKFKKQLMDKILRAQIIKHNAQIDD